MSDVTSASASIARHVGALGLSVHAGEKLCARRRVDTGSAEHVSELVGDFLHLVGRGVGVPLAADLRELGVEEDATARRLRAGV